VVVARTVRIVNSLGLHARPAAAFVRLAGRHACQIVVKKDDLVVNGKSIMGMMMLAADAGSELVIRAEGEGAEQAVEDLVALVQGGFGEQ
jgi:phosphocarrier protein HPr